MSPFAVRVENLSKLYRIGLREKMHETLASAAIEFFRSPLENFRSLRRLTHISDLESESEDVVYAIRDLSFEVERGQILGIIGANGAGKTTLLKVLCGITEPTKGRAIVRGRIATLLEVGTGFHPDLTGRENVYLNGTILGMTKAEIDEKFDEIVAFANVDRFIDTPVKRFSSGMRVRLAFAVAAHLEPEILFIDEVLAVGDAAFQKKCLGKMNTVAQQGRTVLFVSHNLAFVTSLCQRCVLLDQGRLICEGPVEGTLAVYDSLTQDKPDAAFSKSASKDVVACSMPQLIGNAEDLSAASSLAFEWSTMIRRSQCEIKLQLSLMGPSGHYLALPRLNSRTHPLLREPGQYRVRVVLPPLWLAAGMYSVRIKSFAECPESSHRSFSETMNFRIASDTRLDSAGVEVLQPHCEWLVTHA